MVLSVDYRLAPETVFPGPHNACYAALEWLYSNAPALEIDPVRLAVLGDSAGANLAAGIALRARDEGNISRCQHSDAWIRISCKQVDRLLNVNRGVMVGLFP